MEPMELFARYMQAVRKYLPWRRQDDIAAELWANLAAQREEREAEMGRPLTEGEMIDWLKELGPPRVMAARYHAPRSLIGPAIFPMYWQILRLTLIWVSVAYAFSILIRMVIESHSVGWVAGQVGGFWELLIMCAAWVTGAFAVLEYVSERYPEKCPDFLASASHWSPTTLPPLEKHTDGPGKPRNLTVVVAEFVVHFALLLWLLLIPQHPYLLLGPGAAYLKNGPVVLLPVVMWFYWSVVALSAIQFLWQGYILLSDRWRERNVLRHIVMEALGLIPIAVLIAAPGQMYMAANPQALHALPAGLTVAMLNHYAFLGFEVVAFIKIVQFAWELWKATTGTSHPLRAAL